MSPDMMSKLASPEMLETVQKMMKGMEPEALAGMMSQSGMNVTPDQAAQMQKQVRGLRICEFRKTACAESEECLIVIHVVFLIS